MKIPPTGIPLEEIERQAIIEALKMSNWVQKDAAELLAISPRVMNYKIKTLGIDFSRGGRRPMVDERRESQHSCQLSDCSLSRKMQPPGLGVSELSVATAAIAASTPWGATFLYASISCAEFTWV